MRTSPARMEASRVSKPATTQCERVLRYMRDFGSINPVQAMHDLGVMRLGARIFDLKRDGHKIGRRMVAAKNRYNEAVSYAEYRLEE